MSDQKPTWKSFKLRLEGGEMPTLMKPDVPEIDPKDYDSVSDVMIAMEDRSDWVAKNSILQCVDQLSTGKGCGGWNRVEDTVYIQTHWYVEPYSCTGGGYWRTGEGQAICNHCGKRIRLYAAPEIAELKPHFLKVEDEYDQ